MTGEEKVHIQARELDACSLLRGTETTEELIDLFYTPKGLEFCVKHNFPSMNTLKSLHGDILRNRGFYVDVPVRLKNPEKVVLAGGKAIAELEYDDPSVGHHVIVMHGAKAKIKASGYAVVFITNISGEVDKVVNDNAIVM